MKIKTLKYITAVLCTFALMLALDSCKKIDQKKDEAIQQEKADILKNVMDKNPGVSYTVSIPINQKFSYSYYIDKNGLEKMAGHKDDVNGPQTNGFTHCSDAFCPDPVANDYETEQQLASLYRIYYCTEGGISDIAVTWNISVPNTLVSANPADPTQKSIGKIWMRTAAGVNIMFSTTLIPTITSLGTDPDCSFHNVYSVSYALTGIPANFFTNNPGYKIVTLPVIYFGCNDFMEIYSTPSYTYTSPTLYNGDLFTGPCTRTDKCYTNPPSPTYATVAGGYTTCLQFPAYPTDLQRYEYRKKTTGTTLTSGSNTWSAQSSIPESAQNISTGAATPTFSPYTGFLKMADMTPGSGIWIVHYQNVMTGGCSAAPWIEEVYQF